MRIRIKPGFVATVCLMFWAGGRLCLCFLLALVCHEVGHAVTMVVRRVPIYGIDLQTSGALISGGFRGYTEELVCALAGPLTSFLASAVTFRLYSDFSIVSACLGAVNLLPIYPLDGGRILRSSLLLWSERLDVERVVTWVTAVTCATLMLAACWMTVELQSGLWPIFASLALFWRVAAAKHTEG